MPTSIGHALGATAAGWGAAGRAAGRRAWAVQAVLFGVIGAAPDLDLLIGRHSKETHSLGAALIVACVAAVWRWPVASTRARIWLAVFLAYLSHPVLDMLSLDTSVPLGVMFFWPLSSAHVQTGLSIFPSIYRNYHEAGFLAHNLTAIAIEVVILAPLAAIAGWLGRRGG